MFKKRKILMKQENGKKVLYIDTQNIFVFLVVRVVKVLCIKAEDMYFPGLSERVKYLKRKVRREYQQ